MPAKRASYIIAKMTAPCAVIIKVARLNDGNTFVNPLTGHLTVFVRYINFINRRIAQVACACDKPSGLVGRVG